MRVFIYVHNYVYVCICVRMHVSVYARRQHTHCNSPSHIVLLCAVTLQNGRTVAHLSYTRIWVVFYIRVPFRVLFFSIRVPYYIGDLKGGP